MQQLPLDSLRAFISVYELQSFTAAGQQLGRSQPAISLQLQRLEDMLGVRLYARTGGRIQLTPAGAELMDAARAMLNLNDQIIARLTEPELSGRVRLGITSEFASKLLPQVLGQFAHGYPNVALEVTSALSKQLIAKADDFDVIIALTEQGGKDAAQLVNPVQWLELRQEPLVWVGNQDAHLLPSPLPLVLAPDGCIYRRRALRGLRQAGIASRITYTNTDFSGLTAAIESGLGITVLAQSTVPAHLEALQRVADNVVLPELGEVGVMLSTRAAENSAAQQLGQFILERI
ncbi:LysR family transcriptional regulator [Pseudidiomarina sp. 1APP75-32.1]|uniref:LysR family transcriptional regulator n=1 Tax=Pseudidiomarina terrestris TaxID=2820060 RepID=A0AAW7R2W8_9GAMM|nr:MULTISPECIES: LysR family transcriptional regulator [unclassified Pseudidiomarina]MDN7125101.1 LysR family transcriptional regulator [Pseudidiomarina sp. 1APP75-32.1]MDN7127496.1 LysR family transcriptional regulator [Pseudidiomarina sp. 1APR75-33.1]MDN7129862.1 LysR family transcriptional regulator [Pseudidiomarina sp. 1APR75-15]MDN7138447.1 LysR family transcriptional regulator [Pseudidiomarina sp. 1ASP75-14]MEA3589033.1 LysR family transcriptional regulator [Pseudidiomarina sp. 1APP75-27